MGLCRQNTEQIQLSAEERSLAMETLLKLEKKYNGRISATAGPLAEGKDWLEMEKAFKQGRETILGRGHLSGCNGPMETLAVRADGAMVPCSQMSHIELGRINMDDLEEVWQEHAELGRLRERHKIPLKDFEFCQGCEYISYCTGNCPALAYTTDCLTAESAENAEMSKPSVEKMEKEQENHKYPLNQIYFYLTEGCNLRCRHCWIAPKYQSKNNSYPALDLDLFKSIITQAKALGLTGVKLTGGEPLLHPAINEILEHIQTEDLRLTVETNGVLCAAELAEKMAACKDSFVSVSLDGADSGTHEWVRGVEGCFGEAIDGLRNLVSAGLRPQVIMTIMRNNKDQMEQIVRLAEGVGAASVKFNIVQPTARGEKLHNSGEALTIEELVDQGRWVETTLADSSPLPIYFSHPMAFRPLGKMFGTNGDGCGVCRILSILGVLANGSYALCGIGETVPDFVFGHAATDRLEDVWNNNPLLLELREGLPQRFEGICGDCLMKGMCLGSCIAQNYYRNQTIWAPNWYCQVAHDRGLFPDSRILAE
jgi:SynChlorMet cassette radical SAM/SPASM protein ScmF